MDWNALWKKLLFPPFWVTALLFAVSAAALPLVFIHHLTETALAYGIYVLSFYTLCVVSALCCTVLPGQLRSLRRQINAHPIGHRYMTDAAFRTHISLYASLAVNLLYVDVNVLSWHLYRSMWFVVLAVYYGILAVMRFLLVRYIRIHPIGENRLGELRRAKLCSCILLLLNFVLTGAVLMILYRSKGFAYHGILIYVMACYTFYSAAHAIIDLVRYRKYRSPVMTASKAVALSAALVSMLALETAMFSQFGSDMAQKDQRLIIALTGAGVSIAVILMSAFMIIRTANEIKEIKKNGR